jgi:hypothetical protein
MTSISRNLDAADRLARRTVDERVRDAQERARARAVRRRTGPLAQPDAHELPAWTFRFLHTVH